MTFMYNHDLTGIIKGKVITRIVIKERVISRIVGVKYSIFPFETAYNAGMLVQIRALSVVCNWQ